ncbi:hypothetical protein [Roseimicrobium sp. ORNL1]|uniref:hypothetical protein n=1 Tax=Roseimicrobium sp. ORNL1 TaxID=2711231 RepID=UPI0013E1389B|nr:hypothetical protein [Roseimicrobium sp. ORNL1]QIF05149.1 hypothetical protein G5S37_27755 [Roseimicrobium sp. ORNL1]
MASTTYTQRLLYSAAPVLILSCLVMAGYSWEPALHAPWLLPGFLFERSQVMAAVLGTPLVAGVCTVALLLLAACRTTTTVLVTVYFSLNIAATLAFLASYDGHS